MKNNITALVPIKGHSSRVPGKNFKNFCGKPLFKWIIDNLLDCKEIDQIVINTDARELLYESGLVDSDRIYVRDRPSEICGDEVSMNVIIKDDLKHVDSNKYFMTHTTNPLLSSKTIVEAIKRYTYLESQNLCDSMFSVNEIRTRFYTAAGVPVNHDPENLIPTQDLEPWYEENSNFYLFTKDSFATTGARIGVNPKMFVTPPRESIDIDTPEDWELGVMVADFLIAGREGFSR